MENHLYDQTEKIVKTGSTPTALSSVGTAESNEMSETMAEGHSESEMPPQSKEKGDENKKSPDEIRREMRGFFVGGCR